MFITIKNDNTKILNNIIKTIIGLLIFNSLLIFISFEILDYYEEKKLNFIYRKYGMKKSDYKFIFFIYVLFVFLFSIIFSYIFSIIFNKYNIFEDIFINLNKQILICLLLCIAYYTFYVINVTFEKTN